MKNSLFTFLTGFFLFTSCFSEPSKIKKEATVEVNQQLKKAPQKKLMANSALIFSKKEVPILCYHNIRNFRDDQSENIKAYTVKPAAFVAQMKALSDKGFHTVLPNQLYEYLVHDGPLPPKPIMITFDDTREEHYAIGATEMEKHGFKGVFFIMTVSINRPGYMSEEQIKSLSDRGHVIGLHTWDHHKVTSYTDADWEIQLVKPQKKLEAITGKQISCFAYPFGLWDSPAIVKLKNQGYQLAFALSAKSDSIEPRFTVRRMIVSGMWSTSSMLKSTESTFNK